MKPQAYLDLKHLVSQFVRAKQARRQTRQVLHISRFLFENNIFCVHIFGGVHQHFLHHFKYTAN